MVTVLVLLAVIVGLILVVGAAVLLAVRIVTGPSLPDLPEGSIDAFQASVSAGADHPQAPI
jgi:hypothetical protein